MLHLVLYGLLAILVAAGLFLLAARFLPAGEQIAPPLRDEPPWDLPPDTLLQAEDVDAMRLPVALRGYRFAETDLLLDRLAGQLRGGERAMDRVVHRLAGEIKSRDAEIERLRAHAEAAGHPLEHVLAPFAPPVRFPPVAAGAGASALEMIKYGTDEDETDGYEPREPETQAYEPIVLVPPEYEPIVLLPPESGVPPEDADYELEFDTGPARQRPAPDES